MEAAERRSRRRRILLVLVAVLLILAWFFSPISGVIARYSADSRGYQVPAEYSDEEYRMYYKTLNETEQETYRLICAALPSFPDRIAIPSISGKELQNVFTAVSYDNPEFFFLAYQYSFSRSGGLNYFNPEYVMSKSAYESRLKQLRSAADTFLKDAPKTGTDYEKELYVHDKLVLDTEYVSNGKDMVYTAYGCLVDKKCNCEGYSRSVVYLLRKLNVRSCVITGTAERTTGDRANHMWNKVLLDDRPYLLDVTFDDYQIGNATNATERKNGASHMYFNVTKNEIAKNHSFDDLSLVSDCTSTDQNYFRKNGLYYDTYKSCRRDLPEQIRKTLGNGVRSLEFQFSDQTEYTKAKAGLLNNGEIYPLIDLANLTLSSEKEAARDKVDYIEDDMYCVIRIYFK